MKQHITTKQLNELSEKRKEKLREWWKPKEGDWVAYYEAGESPVPYKYKTLIIGNNLKLEKKRKNVCPLLSIGQMIEFLGDNKVKLFFTFNNDIGWAGGGTRYSSITLEKHGKDELCDVLWEAVKEALK